jgi:hypothetical protein
MPAPESEPGPPFFKSWRGAYLFVVGVLAILIAGFIALTRAYR